MPQNKAWATAATVQKLKITYVKELYSLVPKNALNPDWDTFNADHGKKVHDWRKYIHPALQGIWNGFAPHIRNEFAANAQWIADQENWE